MKRKQRHHRARARHTARLVLLSLVALLSLTAGGTVAWLLLTVDTEADAALLESSRGSRTTRLYYNADRSGEVYRAIEWESERIYGSESSFYCSYNDIPPNVINAFLAAEDHRFFAHNGVDWLRTGKAALNLVFHFEERFGGSSITQQLVKNITGDSEQTVARKLREVYRALSIEWRFSKEEILELYLNIVPMGENCIGVGAGAERYFGKEPKELTAAEAATLAAIINAPARYDPVKHPEANRTRRDIILSEMRQYGMLGEEEYRLAVAECPEIREHGVAEVGTIRSWYTETVMDDVIRDLGEQLGYSRAAAMRLLYGGGLEIYTLVDPIVQSALEEGLCSVALQEGVQYAGVVADPETGDILGIVGAAGEKRGNRVFNYATAPAAPGSALKPLSVYAPALDAGLITSATVYDDVPLEFLGKSMQAWPQNSPPVYQGLCDLGTAITTSKNTAAVGTLRMLGKECAFSVLTEGLGLETLIRDGRGENGEYLTDLAEAPLALGQLTYGISPRSLTSAYTALAGDGTYREGRTYLAVYDSDGRLLLQNEREERRVFQRTTASIITKHLEGVVSKGTAKGVYLPGDIAVAGKTGTTTGGRDKWFVGYSPYYLCGVWCGATGERVSVAGKPQIAVFNSVMGELHRDIVTREGGKKTFDLAPGVYECRFCRDGGGLMTVDCLLDPRGDRSTVGWFTGDTMPMSACTCHTGVLCGEDGGVAYTPDGRALAEEITGGEGLRRVGLIRVEGRDFPVQVRISDAEYVLRPIGDAPVPERGDLPYFFYALPPGHYAGISGGEGGIQYNSAYRPPKEEELSELYEQFFG